MSTQPTPIVLCGKAPQVAGLVTELLKPEYEVIHVVLSDEAGKADLPAILTGGLPPSRETADDEHKLGSGDFSRPPVAVVTGGGYTMDVWEDWHATVQKTAGARPVPWLKVDPEKPKPAPGPELAKVLVPRMKDALRTLAKTGGFEKDHVVFF